MDIAPTQIEIVPWNFSDPTPDEYAALNRHMNRSRAESMPDDPPAPLEQTVAELSHIPPIVSVSAWGIWSDDKTEIVASAVASFMRTPENAHLLNFDMFVDAPYRRRGFAKALLVSVVDTARREGRRLLMTDTNERVPAGEAFMARLGAERGLEMHTNQLTLAELDQDLLARWQTEGAARAAGFTLGCYDGSYPEEALAAVAELTNVMNTAPRDGLDMEDMHMTPEQLRQFDESLTASGRTRWTGYARETATGRLVGFTEVVLNPHRPEVVGQGFTGVYPEFRGLGIGRWLKAAMIDRIVREIPVAKFVRTGNADSNAAMLGINHALGFKPYISRCVWQVERDTAAEYLDRDRK